MDIKDNLKECRNNDNRKMPEKILYEVTDDDIKDGIFEMPKDVYEIGKLCFYNCSSLRKVLFSNISKDKKISIRQGAFYQSSIEEFVCENLVVIDSSFQNCSKLKKVILPKGCFINGGNFFTNYAFEGCSLLETVEIPSESYVCSCAFHDCTSLREIKLSEELEGIGSCAFKNCVALTNLSIPSSISIISEYAFSNCTSLDLVIETSLFYFSQFKKTFDVKSLTIYNNKINLDDSVDNINRKIQIIRRKEIDTIVRKILEKNYCDFYSINKQDLDKIEKKINSLLETLERGSNVSYVKNKFESEIISCIEKYIKNLPVLKQYTAFIVKPKEEIYDIVNNFNPILSIKTKDDIQQYGKELIFFPTYIMSAYMRFVQTRGDYNNVIIRMKNILDRLIAPNDRKALFNKLFFRKTNNSNSNVEFNTEFIEDLSRFIDVNEVNLTEESHLLEDLSKLLSVFLDKLKMQIQFIRDYNQESLSLYCQILLSEKLKDLEISLVTMRDLFDRLNILGASNVIIYNKIELLKVTILPKLLVDSILNDKIEKNDNTIGVLNRFALTLEEIIVENEKDTKLLQIDTNLDDIKKESNEDKIIKKVKA